MAGDLIPPPSPAGTPPPDPLMQPMAASPAEAVAEPAAPAAGTPPPFRSRFGFVWGALAGIAVCAAGVLALLVTAKDDAGPALAANWSPWQPASARMLDGAEDIAAHVALEYKLDGGDQLVQINTSPLELGGEPIGVAVRPLGRELEYLEGDGLLYALSGLGPNGQLPGTPTRKRGRLLLREALELALYSFRYLDDVTMVAVLLPRTAEQQAAEATGPPQTNAVFFRPGDLLPKLQVPLEATLALRTPRPSTMTEEEAARVDSLTLRNLFIASVQQLEADRSYLVLAEPETVR